MERRLSAILAADVVGYSRLMGADEAGTLAALRQMRRELFEPLVSEHRGTIVKRMGDGWLVEFASAGDAVTCAVAVQESLADNEIIKLRMGVHIGDVVHEDEDIYGDGVNIAARLQEKAAPGCIVISDMARRSIDGKLASAFNNLGTHELKNISEPVVSYGWGASTIATTEITPDSAPPLPDKPSVAVLPFQNMSGDAEQEYFADGITEDIITALSRVRRFFVIARNSTFAYKGKSSDIREVARELGVRYVLEGSVRKASNRIRLTAQLLDGTTRSHLWAERYDRELADIFDLQDELTQTLVGAIEPELNRAEQERARLNRPDNLDVWGMYQRGMSQLHQLTKDSLADAEVTLSGVTRTAPGFAAASAGLADVHYYKLVLGFAEDPQAARDAALAAGRRAVELDREDADAHCAAGRAYLSNRMFDDAIGEFRETLVISPSHARAHYGLGATYVFRGEPEPSLPHIEDAIRLSPRDPNMGSFLVRKAQALLYLRRHEEAAEWARRALRLPGSQWSRQAMLSSALGHLGRIEEARSVLDELLRHMPGFSAQFALDFSPWLDDEHFHHLMDGLHKAGLAA